MIRVFDLDGTPHDVSDAEAIDRVHEATTGTGSIFWQDGDRCSLVRGSTSNAPCKTSSLGWKRPTRRIISAKCNWLPHWHARSRRVTGFTKQSGTA
jgi:hypothetical protein